MNASTVKSENFGYIKWAGETSRAIVFYQCYVLFLLGILLNIIQILIFQRKTFKKTTMSFYYTINSAIHICIFVHLLTFGIPITQNRSIILKSDWNCRMYLFVLRTLYQSSSWLNVAISTDRLLFVIFFHKYKFQKNKKILSLILLVILVIIFLLNSPNFWFYIAEIKSNSSLTNQTSSKYCTSSQTALLFRDIFAIAIRTVVPFILMLVINLVLIIKVKQSRQKFGQKKRNSQEFNFVFTVIITTFIFLLTYMPNVVWIALSNYFQNNSAIKQRQTWNAFLFLFEVASSSTYFAYYSLNIFFQLAFNSVFRYEVVKILSYRCLIVPVNHQLQSSSNDVRTQSRSKNTRE
ncbi:G-coupled receptor -like protein [Brachionus plicatilis]|uniref:G-coupled receptor-like protein n=1 Tax=Brachionus plicatilis TaxID=10195 RepID=A0A3M7S645_BRAPC|nr:G-coupled receptor -like protein [Brachionus plicatilis]